MLVLLAGIIWIWRSVSGVTLTLTKPVGGTVIGGGLICGTQAATCSARRPVGDLVELHVVADPGYVFAGFVGDCAPAGQILMTKAKTCVANFTQVGPASPQGQGPPAERLFYEMKTQDVVIARIEVELARTGSTVIPENLRTAQARRRQFEQFYEEVAANSYGSRLNERERLILRITRLLGECDLAAPPDYLREVNRYVERWRSTPRFEQAMNRAQQNGYAKPIAAAFIARQLPPHYFYLALQESNFMATVSGPVTRWGIAKGMWQLMPEIARRYGLNVGPYQKDQRTDMADDRLDWEKATVAAASYIKDIYATDAQASSLLVMASYNWGERRVLDRLSSTLSDRRFRSTNPQ